jgi:hypothetical protein
MRTAQQRGKLMNNRLNQTNHCHSFMNTTETDYAPFVQRFQFPDFSEPSNDTPTIDTPYAACFSGWGRLCTNTGGTSLLRLLRLGQLLDFVGCYIYTTHAPLGCFRRHLLDRLFAWRAAGFCVSWLLAFFTHAFVTCFCFTLA